MINSNELRIGNWVYKQSNKLVIDISVPFQLKIVSPQECHKWTSISLAYDFLIKYCGFTDYAKNGWGCRLYLDSSTELCWYIQDCCVRYQSRSSGFTHNFGIVYLHQLQNLYFIITGKELEIKL